MKIKLHNPYGYKVCFSYKNKKRKINIKTYVNTYNLAKFEKNLYEKQYLEDKITWYILPVKKREYNRIWKGCPF